MRTSCSRAAWTRRLPGHPAADQRVVSTFASVRTLLHTSSVRQSPTRQNTSCSRCQRLNHSGLRRGVPPRDVTVQFVVAFACAARMQSTANTPPSTSASEQVEESSTSCAPATGGAAAVRDGAADAGVMKAVDGSAVRESPPPRASSEATPKDQNSDTSSGGHPQTLGSSLEEALAKEEQSLEEEEEEAADVDDASSTADEPILTAGRDEHYVTDHHRRREYERKVKQVQRLMGLQEVLSRETLQKCLHYTHVSTTSGVHWQDVSPNATLRDRPGFQRQTEGFFAHAVLDSLFGKSLAPELSAFVMDGNPLPHVVMGKNWWGLTLRVSHEGSAAVQLSSLVDLADDSALRDSERARVRNLEAVYGAGASAEDSDQEVATYAKYLFGGEFSSSTASGGTAHRAESGTKLWSRLKTLFAPQRRQQSTASRRRARSRPPHRAVGTLQHFSSKLTVVIVRETHPLDTVLRAATGSDTPVDPTAAEEASWEEVEQERQARRRPVVPYDPNNPVSSDSAEPQETATANDKAEATPVESTSPTPRTPQTRYRVVSIHRHPIPFLDAAFANWPLLATSRLVAPIGVPAVDTVQDVVRLMLRGAVASFQEDAYSATRQMELIESRIYEVDADISNHRETVSRTMAHLHVMSRRARAQEMILRDTHMTALRLRALTPSEETPRDVQDRAFITRCISLATHVEEHTESLLFLQFQVVSGEMADNLRTLTVFSTFFIPLSFLLNVFNMRFDGLLQWCEEDTSLYIFVAILTVTALGMARFVRRYLQN